MKLDYGKQPEQLYAEFTVGIGPERRGSKRVVVAERFGWAVRRLVVVAPEHVEGALPNADNLARLVLDARLDYEVQDRLRALAERDDVILKTVEVEAQAPLADALPLTSWRVQAVLYLRELRRTGKLALPTEKALADQFKSLDLVRGAGGKLSVVPGVLPLVDAILLTLQPLLRTASPVRAWIGR